MSEDGQTLPSKPFKGKKIEIAPSKGVEMFADITEEFMDGNSKLGSGQSPG